MWRAYCSYARWARDTARRWADRHPWEGLAVAVVVVLGTWAAIRWAARHLP